MKKVLISALLVSLYSCAEGVYAKGSFSSSGSGGFSSRSRSFSSPSRSYSAPSSVSKSYSAPVRSTPKTVSNNNTTVVHHYNNTSSRGGAGFGTGILAGAVGAVLFNNFIHPAGTVPYTGTGYTQQGTVLYPDGSVINSSGYKVGTYQNGQFTPQDGGQVAQPAQPVIDSSPPVLVESADKSFYFFSLLAVLILTIAIIAFLWSNYPRKDVIEVSEAPQRNIVGNLKRKFRGTQAYVIDPSDGTRVWVNTNDDMYEDANQKVWRLY
jgi:hypothetical protein